MMPRGVMDCEEWVQSHRTGIGSEKESSSQRSEKCVMALVMAAQTGHEPPGLIGMIIFQVNIINPFHTPNTSREI